MASETMRAVDIKDGAGPVSALFINDAVPRPRPSPNQCLVKVKAFGLNRADTLQREGKYPVPPGVTKIMGLEFAGTIAEIGQLPEGEEERHHWAVGDEVFGLAYGGTYAEYVAINKGMLLRKPEQLDWITAAGIPETWFTALQALHLVGQYSPETTRSILWHAGASSVSIAGIQLSRLANEHLDASSELPSHSPAVSPPKVFATARRDDKCDFTVKTLGATAAFNTEKVDWVESVVKANDGRGMDLVIDYIGAPYFQGNLDVLALDGRVVQLGTMGGTKLPEGVDIGAFVRKRARFMGSTLRSRSPEYQTKLRGLFEEKVLPGILSGKFDIHTDTVLPWEQIQEAHGKMEKNETRGKVVCTID